MSNETLRMSNETVNEALDDLNRILDRHRERAAIARAAAEERARGYNDARHECGVRLRGVALPLLRDWSKRLSVEGYPTSVDDRIGCHPPSLILRLAPHGGPESSLALACEIGRIVHFKMTIGGKDAGSALETPLAGLEDRHVLEGLGRFVAEALEATLPHDDCGP
jgi:hypothetical protein